MSNGSGDGGSDDEGRAESSSSIPQVFGEVFLIGDGFSNENKVKGGGRVMVAGVNKVRDVLVAHEEPPNIVNSSGEGVGLEVGGRHGK